MTLTSNQPTFGDSKYLSEQEMPLFFKAAIEMSRLRDTALCLLIFFTGCRPSEALLLRPENLYPDHSMISMPTLKQRSETIPTRYVYVPPYLMEILVRLCKADRRIINLGRTRAWEIVGQCMENAGLSGKKACSRGLRHSFTTGNLKIETPLSEIQKRAGHSRLESTMRYMDLIDDDARRYAERFWEFATGGILPEDSPRG